MGACCTSSKNNLNQRNIQANNNTNVKINYEEDPELIMSHNNKKINEVKKQDTINNNINNNRNHIKSKQSLEQINQKKTNKSNEYKENIQYKNTEKSEKLACLDNNSLSHTNTLKNNILDENNHLLNDNEDKELLKNNTIYQCLEQANKEDNLPQQNTLEVDKEKFNINNDDNLLNMNIEGTNRTELPIYHISKYFIHNTFEFATSNDYTSILKKAKCYSKSILSLKLLILKERRWIKELVEISEVSQYKKILFYFFVVS